MRAADRILVCEGSCNPDIGEVDQLVELVEGGRLEARPYSRERTRALHHTVHEPVEDHTTWDIKAGWCRRYRCTVCGRVRRF